ncbi:hypothetical protein ACFSZS_14520 [Seohaeicola zhoushanensis]
MDQIVGRSGTLLTLDQVRAAVSFDQPNLIAESDGKRIRLEGTYLVFEKGVVAAPDGPITSFEISMELSERYPRQEPRVFETGERIPRVAERHINPNGDCCVTVWENWLVEVNDHTLSSYLNGPMNEYFLGQFWYEKTGKWPFGERSHGLKGLEEAYADALGISNNAESLRYHLRLLSHDWPKGHWLCPCKSGKLLRHCHRDDLAAMHAKVPPPLHAAC